MLKNVSVCLLLVSAAVIGAADTASAQQTLNLNIGYFAVKGQDARVGANCTNCGRDVDVLLANHDFLTFDYKDFNGASVGAEWLVPLGQFAEAGAGISFYRRTVPSVYTNYVDANRNEVDQNLRLRAIPIDLSLRILPLGQRSPFQPYFGAGIGIVNWRYSEFGRFIDFNNGGRTPFEGAFVANGTSTGPVALGGIRFADGGLSVGGEVRYRKADGSVGDDFAGTKIDLGGWTYQGTIGFRFGR